MQLQRLTCFFFLPLVSDGFESVYLLLTARSMHLVFHLLDACPQAWAITVSAPTLAGLRTLSLSPHVLLMVSSST